MVPFDVRIPPGERTDVSAVPKSDPDVPGYVLVWAVDGAVARGTGNGARAASGGAITQSGLTLADRVRTAPGAWRTRSETATGAGGVLAQWIRPDGVAGGDCEEPLADLHAPYTRWAQPVRSPALSERAFAGALRARGVRKVKRRVGNTWASIGLPDHRPDKDD